MKGEFWTPAEDEQLRLLYAVKGASPAEISPLLGRSARAIEARVKRLGIKSGKNIVTTRERPEVMHKLRQAFARGEAIEHVAARLKLGYQTVSRFYEEFASEASTETRNIRLTGYVGAKEMIEIAAAYFGVTTEAVLSSNKYTPFRLARWAVAKALSDKGASTARIARRLNFKCHSTVCHILKNFDKAAAEHYDLLLAYEAIKEAERQTAMKIAA